MAPVLSVTLLVCGFSLNMPFVDRPKRCLGRVELRRICIYINSGSNFEFLCDLGVSGK